MMRLIHAMLRDPLLYGLAGFAVLLVAGLVFGDWRDKRRNRAMLALRRQSREQKKEQPKVRMPVARPPFRLFRWQFVLAAFAVGAFLLRDKKTVSARGPAVPASTAASARPARNGASAGIAAAPLVSSNSVSVTATNLVSSRSGQALPADLDWQRSPLSFPNRSGSILNRPGNGLY